MLSLELAKRLKELGLEWEPQRGDWYYNHHGYVSGTTTTLDLLNEVTVLIQSISRDYANRTVHFAPRLDQLLAEIEKRGWDIDLMHFAKNRDNTEVRDDPSWSCEVNKFLRLRQGDDGSPKLMGTDHEVNVNGPWQEERLNEFFDTDSPEEATAQALIWILEQEGAN